MNEDVEFKNEKQSAYSVGSYTECPECGSSALIYDDTRGEIICNNCGVVIEAHKVQMGPEWRSYTPEEERKKRRVGAPIRYSLREKTPSTMVGLGRKEIYGPQVSSKRRAQIYRLRKWQRRMGGCPLLETKSRSSNT